MKILIGVCNSLLLLLAVNCFWLIRYSGSWLFLPFLLIAFIGVNFFPSYGRNSHLSLRLRICADGCALLWQFLFSALLTAGFLAVLAFRLLPAEWEVWAIGALLALGGEAIVFWNGILRVYCTSVQLGLRRRLIGILFGWIPLVNCWVLGFLLGIVSREIQVETEQEQRNKARREQGICRTKYPLLLVHGVFFRDNALLNYWGRIPETLQQNGAQIYYGNHQSAASVPESAEELTRRIREIVAASGCEKVNIIAHSKGGLDCRYGVSCLGAAPLVASITTINTPHRGCLFAEYLLEKIPQKTQNGLAQKYNATLKKLGDEKPDFMAAVVDLTAQACEKRNLQIPDMPGVYCQSVGSKLNHATGGRFPLNLSYPLVKHFDGANDGLVAEDSFAWGEKYTFLTVEGKRGISHGDMIDLNRENIPGFDVREFYVQLVAALKQKGL